jgi:AraC-like DNA-binding protein
MTTIAPGRSRSAGTSASVTKARKTAALVAAAMAAQIPSKASAPIRVSRCQCPPGAPVTEVAMACGSASSAHFATIFRKATGRTPSARRRTGTR